MRKAIILLCLGLAGCATVAKENKMPPPAVAKQPVASVKAEPVAPPPKTIVIDQKQIREVISIFSEAIRNNPKYAGAYYNRAIAYFYDSEYDKSWQDVSIAESLGCKFSDDFIESLIKASGSKR
ncbi:MAG TPA: tetratricopeptide repeat protein [Candidatus Margulisiibacteriota bacterium]|nr:tetratricopeptide repeat protein [Candidatus Margulisiibacteriota bacterium]